MIDLVGMKIKEHLPKKVEKKPIQAYIPAELFEAVQKQIKKDDVSLTDLLVACLRAYLDESKK